MNRGISRSMSSGMKTYQMEKLKKIDQISFAVQDTLLYLDTHPEDADALAFFDEHSKMRNDALADYAKEFGPLLIDDVTKTDANYWNWINQPWPWDGEY